jgi:predicted O-linked N-acetylglucosamine transferase (SPINDLY family)
MKTAAAALARGRALLAQGRTRQAIGFLQIARRDHPGHPGIALALADACHSDRRLDEAIEAYHTAIAFDETSAEAWYGLGCAQLAKKSFGASAQSLSRAAVLAPGSFGALYNLAKSRFELGAVDAAVATFERAAVLDPAHEQTAHASIAVIIPGSMAADNAAVLRARRRWALAEAAALPPPAPFIARPGGKIRLGYMSAFFGERNWMKPVFALLNRHDRETFEIHMFSDGKPPSPQAGYRDHDHDYVHDLRGVDNERAADIIRASGIDILIDLNGYGAPHRLGTIMRRPAPKILGWFNMFATTGMPAFDYIIGDAQVIPQSEEKFYTEQVHRLPGSYLAFEVLYPVPDVAPPPCAAGGGITFGCLGSHYKLDDAVVDSWARIRRAAAGARLFVKNAALEDASTRAEFLQRFAARGIPAGRITLQGRSEHFEFLEAYEQIDIALDTFPYNGGTTTTEALWQGVPVLAFDGDRWASRTSKSLLLAAGLAEWLMPDQAAYEARAIALANDPGTPPMLAHLRAGLRDRVQSSAACDTASLCAAVQRFYRSIATPAAP